MVQVRASHILVPYEDQAVGIMEKIQNADDFADMAKRYSRCPSRKKGGDLGWFGPGMMVPEFDKATFEAEVGKVAGPVKTEFGFHLILVTDRK